MRRLLKDRRGGVPVFFLAWVLALLMLTFLVIEMGSTFENYDYAVDVLQRSCNIAVEGNILDEYRADNVLVLDPAGAEADFRSYMANDLSSRYTVVIDSISCTETPPSLTAIGKVSFQTVFSQFGFGDLTFSFKVRSTNYDLE